MSSPRRPWISIAVIPLMLIIGLESAWAAFACQMDGEVRDRCCCPSTQRDDAPLDTNTIAARCCCDVTLHASADVSPVRDQSRTDEMPIALVLPAPTSLPAPVRASRILAVTPVARPPPWRSLYLEKHSLLR